MSSHKTVAGNANAHEEPLFCDTYKNREGPSAIRGKHYHREEFLLLIIIFISAWCSHYCFTNPRYLSYKIRDKLFYWIVATSHVIPHVRQRFPTTTLQHAPRPRSPRQVRRRKVSQTDKKLQTRKTIYFCRPLIILNSKNRMEGCPRARFKTGLLYLYWTQGQNINWKDRNDGKSWHWERTKNYGNQNMEKRKLMQIKFGKWFYKRWDTFINNFSLFCQLRLTLHRTM